MIDVRYIRVFGHLCKVPGRKPVREALQRRGWRPEFAIWDGVAAEFWTLNDDADEVEAEVWTRPGRVLVPEGHEFSAGELGLFAAFAEGYP